jgi:hypothetical protein
MEIPNLTSLRMCEKAPPSLERFLRNVEGLVNIQLAARSNVHFLVGSDINSLAKREDSDM